MFRGAGALVLGAMLASGVATAASAATYNFSLVDPDGYVDGGDDGDESSGALTLTDGDLSVTFSGLVIADDDYDGDGVMSGATVGPAASIFRYNNGLGIRGVSGDPQHSIDAIGPVEMVQMSFFDGDGAVNVRLTELIFGWVGGPSVGFDYGYENTSGAFEIILDTVDGGIGNGDTRAFTGVMGTTTAEDDEGGYGKGTFSFASGPVLTDSTFGIKAGIDGVLPGSWKLRGIGVETVMAPPPPPEVIPLPAAAWLLIGGLGSLLAFRRRA